MIFVVSCQARMQSCSCKHIRLTNSFSSKYFNLRQIFQAILQKHFFYLSFQSDLPNNKRKMMPQFSFAPSIDRLNNKQPPQHEKQLNRSQTTPITLAQRQRSQQTGQSNTWHHPSHPHRFNVQKVNILSQSDSDEESNKTLPNYSIA